MCGIAGLMTRDGSPPDGSVLDRLARSLVHRGPDGEGRYTNGGMGLVHRRLAIIDLETGDQPLREPDGAVLIANAEIYNYLELRKALKDVSFATASDCEPPLHLYRREGAGFDAQLRGMYAIALYDPDSDRLVLSRDPFGIKPLYYAEGSQGFAFASEPQALVAAGLVEPRINPQARDELLELQFTTGADTIFSGIKRVLPGETIVVSAGRIIDRHRRDALPGGETVVGDEQEAMSRLDAALNDSVTLHQRSDVPFGMFLSGGVDSSTLLALMARHNDQPVLAFTVGFPGSGAHDERAHARMLAERVGARHVDVPVGEADFWDLLPEIAAAMDDPAADYAVLPTYVLGRLAGQHVKVVLTGEGGDELFAGYGRYRSARRPWWLGGRVMRPRGTFDNLGVLRQPTTGWRDGIVAAGTRASGGGRTPLQIAQATDCADWLPHDLLLKVDRCLMAHGVEGRVPLLDPAVAAAVFPLPDRFKVNKGVGKYVLRKWLDQHLPEAVPFSKKRGFTVPVGEWIAGRGEQLGALVASSPGIEEICRPEGVVKVFRTPGKREGFAAWTLLFYALWYRRHILGQLPEGDTFEYLSAAP